MLFLRTCGFLAGILSLYPQSTSAQYQGNSSTNTTYTNPILNKFGADPWVTRFEDYYYMTYTTSSNVTILRSKTLTKWDDADEKLAFNPPEDLPYSTDLWAPELHILDGKWYIIFTADPNHDSPTSYVDMLCPYDCPAVHHRMYVLEGSTTDPWTSTYALKAQLNTFDQFAIDGTYFQHETGLYHIYSCWEDAYSAWPSNLCITAMSNPWTVSSSLSDRVIISRPTNPWEKTPFGRTENDRLSSNEGPEQLVNPVTNQSFILYSAARSDNRNYCLGLLELVGTDPMDAGSWVKDDGGCVFYENDEAEAYGPGHASFVKSPDGGEEWVVYHGLRDLDGGFEGRTIRTQRFWWGEDGRPVFPRPGYGPFEVPSGQL